MSGSFKCHSVEVLSRLVNGLLSADEVEELASHVERCERCGHIVDELLSHDPLAVVAHSVTGDVVSTALSALMDRLREMQPNTLLDSTAETQRLTDPVVAEAALTAILASPLQPDELGRLGHYRVLKVTGTGGMGVVFQAEDLHLKRKVALKVMRPKLFEHSDRERFLREARSAAAIKHEHVVAIYQVGEDRGCPFLAMEFLEGEPLDQRLKQRPQLTLAEVLRIGRETAEGLAAAHELGLIHRDIKPANIWLETIDRPLSAAMAEDGLAKGGGAPQFRVKILDFGLARARQEDVQLTQSGLIVGTPAYMAPEQARGMAVDHRSDLFSLGCVLYHASTGVRPFPGKNTLEILASLAMLEPAAPAAINPEIPRALSDLILQLLAKDPEDRPVSATEVVAALAAIEQPGVQVAWRRRAAVLALATVLLVAMALTVIRVQTPMGEFVIEADDPQVAVAVVNPHTVKLIHRETGRQYLVNSQQLPEGDYELLVTDETVGLQFSARRFTIQAQDPPTRVSVWFEKKETGAAEVTPVPTGSVPPRAIAPFRDGQAEQLQKNWATYLGVPVEFTNAVGMTLRLIPPGEFRMGSTQQEIQELLPTIPAWNRPNVESEGPQRVVRIEHAFYLAVHEVTVEQFRAFVQATGYKSTAERTGKGGRVWNSQMKKMESRSDWIWSHPFVTVTENHPVVLVSSEDVEAFLAWLKERDGRSYSLPTEEQWEFACRAGTASRWYWGDNPAEARQHAWLEDRATSARQMPVGLREPNPFGLYDMLGNVSEMTRDGDGGIIFRGGNAGYIALYARSASRELESHSDPTYRNGFRVVCSVAHR